MIFFCIMNLYKSCFLRYCLKWNVLMYVFSFASETNYIHIPLYLFLLLTVFNLLFLNTAICQCTPLYSPLKTVRISLKLQLGSRALSARPFSSNSSRMAELLKVESVPVLRVSCTCMEELNITHMNIHIAITM